MTGFMKRRVGSAQELLPLDEIVGDTIRLRSGECRAVLQAGCVNFALKSESEQDAILAGYRRLLNGLSYPLQVLVRVVPTNVDGYLAGLEPGGHSRSEALQQIARDHEAFVRRIARERTLLDRRFYVVIPSGAETRAASGIRWPWRAQADAQERARLDLLATRRRLAFRCAEVGRGLGAFGVTTRRLDEQDLVELWRTTLAGTASEHAQRVRSSTAVVVAAVRGTEAAYA